MDLFEAIEKRCSVRTYLSKPVAKEDLDKIIDAARRAPTGRNEQPWEFVIVTDMYGRQRIAELTPYGKHIGVAGACIAVFCRDSTTYYVEDGAAATMSILLAATALGLGSCWVAGDKTAHAQAVADLLGAPQTHRLVSLVAIGYSGEDASPKPKRPLDEVVHWENW